ncbi:MAG: mannose-1-phosphate guanylyltransferase [Flavobacteriales bacterium]|nr:mannose-1-phosphate guanylyltransferase [Flavobacteriales bacterium]
MAGGIGSRLWPMSRTANPKQFHDVLGVGRTLIQMTFDRFKDICLPENMLVVTNAQYKEQVMKQLPEIPEKNILLEPDRRNTAPCIAYACFRIETENPDARIVVASSDHLILKDDVFRETILLALDQASAKDCLITLGIKPSRPDTGYGYIQFEDDADTIDPQVKKVKTFTEKPDLEIAKQFIESGDFYWNSGIFIWSLKSILKAFEKHMPHTNGLFVEGRGKYGTDAEAGFIQDTYQQCKNISIDYGVMEKAKNVFVVLSDFGWSDLGTWGSLYTHVKQDENKNAVVGRSVKLYDSSNCMVNVPKNKLVVIQGLEDMIVVESDNILLICKRSEEQKIKQFVNDIKVEKGDKFV